MLFISTQKGKGSTTANTDEKGHKRAETKQQVRAKGRALAHQVFLLVLALQ